MRGLTLAVLPDGDPLKALCGGYGETREAIDDRITKPPSSGQPRTRSYSTPLQPSSRARRHVNRNLALYQSMAGSRSVFRDPLPISNELCRLVQDQLSEVPRTNTLNDLKTTIETLSTLTRACESVLADISAPGQEADLPTAVKGIKNVLTWTKCSSTTCLPRQG